MVHVSGLGGELRAGYQLAASLGAWTLAPSSDSPHTFIFRAKSIDEHVVWIRYQPLDLVLSLGSTEWRWHGVVLGRDEAGIVIELRERPVVTQRGTK